MLAIATVDLAALRSVPGQLARGDLLAHIDRMVDRKDYRALYERRCARNGEQRKWTRLYARLGLNSYDVARKLDVSESTLRRYEREGKSPRMFWFALVGLCALREGKRLTPALAKELRDGHEQMKISGT